MTFGGKLKSILARKL
jgi:hypothetical protein